MNKQKVFDFNFNKNEKKINFYINSTNIDAYNGVIYSNNINKFLVGPNKSGKSYLANMWLKKNNAIIFNNNFDFLINNKSNILIENINSSFDEEKLFHILNHSKLYNLNILITSSYEINDIKFLLKDLISRLKIFNHLKIHQPDDDMLINLMTKFFIEKQFIINSYEIFQYILNQTNRSYENILNIVTKLDTLSLEKKRQLTIPLIKEIL